MVPLSEATAAVATAGVCLVLGYLVKYRGWTALASGVPAVEGAEAVTANVVGNVLFAVGGAVLLFGVLLALGVDRWVPRWALALGLLLAAVLAAPRLGMRFDPG